MNSPRRLKRQRNRSIGFSIVLVISVVLFERYNPYRPTIPTASDEVLSTTDDGTTTDTSLSSTATATTTKIPEDCTNDQLEIIQKHLSPSKCNGSQPWLQQCSLTKATHCVEPSWLYDHYRNDYDDDAASNDGIWIGMNVGCNKGFDAINMARMLSHDTSTFEREKWKKPMEQQGVRVEVGCELQSTQYEPMQPSTRIAHVYCVEPMPLTVNALQHSAQSLQIPSTQSTSPRESTSKLTIIKAAIGLRTTEKGALFPAVVKSDELEHNKVQIGTENIGLGSSASKCDPKNPASCEEVPVLSLDDFVAKYVTPSAAGVTSKIKMITIDVEGYDFDVVLGGVETFRNLGVEYVEVEYNWVGSWISQKLRDFINHMLSFQYACYWAGKGELWRITGCFLDFYEFHTWANIACVSTTHNPKLATRMERIFIETLANDTIAYGY